MRQFQNTLLLLLIAAVFVGCQQKAAPSEGEETKSSPQLIVLGNAQDAGFPQVDCRKNCCSNAWNDPSLRRMVVSLGLHDPQSGSRWLFEATPDFKEQLHQFDQEAPKAENADVLQGIFLTHAHMGHYTGLMHLGREAMGAPGIPVYAMPRMRTFLSENGPWSQLVSLENIVLKELAHDKAVELTSGLRVIPILVPHRDEFSETVGFRIEGPNHKALFIPDIDKWERWERDIREEIKLVDYAFLDATFFENGEIPGRDMAEIPHPFVAESMALLKDLPDSERKKVHFIHFNHTNPLLDPKSDSRKQVMDAGFRIAEEGMRFPL